ncbi:hypothetical protein TNCT_643621 [Trichonephila clavata]|uniref:Uncharacterized protein n=1 Tax=Trichonephila clavata TaxID=2740835 RepID=A0A8X6F4R8_TRICU|nr:hypothetical protein TNCT_643621 [Trichonephila clavata]
MITKRCPEKVNFRMTLSNGQAYTCLERLRDIPVERDGKTSDGVETGVAVKTMAFHVDAFGCIFRRNVSKHQSYFKRNFFLK